MDMCVLPSPWLIHWSRIPGARTQGHQPSPRGRSRNGSLHGARLEQNWAAPVAVEKPMQ